LKHTIKNKHIAVLFFILTLLFVTVAMTNNVFFEWAFDRHHNQWSWYIRPLFLIPFCYFSFKRNLSGIAITTFCLFTSMFWFARPDIVSDQVKEFLQFEKDYLYGTWTSIKILMALTIPISFIALALAFWKRKPALGIAVVVFMAVGKIAWSIQNAGESGQSILAPAMIGLILCCGLIYYGFKKLNQK
jgi:hypothetical protein